MGKDIAVIASLDSSWLASRDIDYGISIIKTSLIFFDEIEIMDSELIDSNQMRYAFDNGMRSLLDYNKVNIVMREDSLENLLAKELGKDKPMLFGSLDYISNGNIAKIKTSGNLSVASLYQIFDNDDVRSGRYGALIPYREYISSIDKITGHRLKFNIDKNLFSSNLHYFLDKLSLPQNINLMDVKFSNRSDVYNYIESINNSEVYNGLELKSTIKALADVIYILNKAEFLLDYASENDSNTIYMLFDKEHYNSIEKYLKSQNIKIQDILELYRHEIKLVKIEPEPIEMDSDIHFFIKNIVPVSVYSEKNRNFLQNLENELDREKNDEKLGFLKFSTGRSKYSRYLERKVPRFRSAMEMTILIISLFSISIDLLFNHAITSVTVISLFFGSIIFVDGALGFVEYYSRKKTNTTLYNKIIDWYNKIISERK